MPDPQEPKVHRTGVQKLVSVKEDGYYSNCTMVESTPFDISILFGKIRPRTDEQGRPSVVEVYEKQVYLAHLQAKALWEALGKALSVAGRPSDTVRGAESEGTGRPRQ